MTRHQITLPIAALTLLLAAKPALGQDSPEKPGANSPSWYNPARYNPMKLIKPGPKSANDQLASNGHFEDKLTKQLRLAGILPAETEMQDVCSTFKDLATCIAVLRLTHDLKLEFTCLKWNVTGTKPKPVADSCAGPSDAKAMPLSKALNLLVKPDVDATTQSKSALQKAHADIKDAST